jgi:hypothetical protein
MGRRFDRGRFRRDYCSRVDPDTKTRAGINARPEESEGSATPVPTPLVDKPAQIGRAGSSEIALQPQATR